MLKDTLPSGFLRIAVSMGCGTHLSAVGRFTAALADASAGFDSVPGVGCPGIGIGVEPSVGGVAGVDSCGDASVGDSRTTPSETTAAAAGLSSSAARTA